ncbi:MAG TPA: hypothetical protein PLD84_08925, partial [Chitinophagales bacterium]|nr:hypothetical protein [Chitinophagales bacterium]
IGRDKAFEMRGDTDHRSMSISITENRLRLLGEAGKSSIVIEDVTNGVNTPIAGTRVRITIPQPA